MTKIITNEARVSGRSEKIYSSTEIDTKEISQNFKCFENFYL